MSNTFLVTGCCGFIGSNMCNLLLRKNHKIIGLDNLLTGRLSNIQNLKNKKRFLFIEHDIINPIKIEDKIDYIIHFASTASPIDYIKYPILTLKVGSIGTENILNLAVKNRSKIVVASTSEIYGDPLEHPQKESYYGNVNPIGPRGVYDEAKRYLEAITMAYHKKMGLDIKIARIFNSYGPNMRKDDGRAIPNFINQMINNENITVYGNGTQTRSFCYVTDTIEAIYKLVRSDYNYPVNIGNPNEYTILELIEKIRNLISSKSKIKFLKLPENDPKVRRPDITLAKKILNWEPKICLEDGLKKTIDYFYN